MVIDVVIIDQLVYDPVVPLCRNNKKRNELQNNTTESDFITCHIAQHAGELWKPKDGLDQCSHVT